MPEEISFVSHLAPPDAPLSLDQLARRRAAAWKVDDEQRERDRRLQLALADRRKRAWIEQGNDDRQPPAYRGVVFDHADRDGVHPSSFPPYRDEPQGPLSDAFLDFQAHNQTTLATHPQYYCIDCKIRYNARDGGRCGPCLGKLQPVDIRRRRRTPAAQSPEYPT